MDKDKSILEKFTETMKGLADTASEALKSEEPANAPVAAYMPLGAEGLVSDPLLVPPVAAQPVRKKRRVAKKAAKRNITTAKTSAPKKAARKAAKTSARKSAKTSAKKASAKKAARVSAKKRSKKTAKGRR